MRHLKNFKKFKKIDEIFGFSKKEKEEKELNLKLKKVEDEINKYNIINLFRQPKDDPDDDHIQKLTKISLNNAKSEMPTLYELLPELFEYMGTVVCKVYMDLVYEYPHSMGINYINGIIPSNFHFLRKNGELITGKEGRKLIIDYTKDKLKMK